MLVALIYVHAFNSLSYREQNEAYIPATAVTAHAMHDCCVYIFLILPQVRGKAV